MAVICLLCCLSQRKVIFSGVTYRLQEAKLIQEGFIRMRIMVKIYETLRVLNTIK